MQGQNGYVNGVEELNKICSIYGTGEGAASARTVNVDDIDWITGYNPNNTGVKDKEKTGSGRKCYGDTSICEYGNNVEYTLTTGGVKYTSKGNSVAGGTNSSYTSFTYHDPAVTSGNPWKSLATTGNTTTTLRSTAYYYYPTTLTETNDINATVGIASTSPEYKMLFTNSTTGADTANGGNTTNFYYWLGSPYVYAYAGVATFGLRYVYSGYVLSDYLYRSVGSPYNGYLGVCPVVSLDQKIQLKDSGTGKDGCKLYNLAVE